MHVRRAQVAGSFYSGHPKELLSTIERYMAEASVEPRPERVASLIVPHAGYIFSGFTAAHGYKRVQGMLPGRIVLLGVSHYHHFPGISPCPDELYETPLGEILIDREFRKVLEANFSCITGNPFEGEHTLETQLPFIRHLFGNIPVMPVLFGTHATQEHIAFGEQLAALLQAEDLVIASTDLSHFFNEETARTLDTQAISLMLSGDLPALMEGLRRKRCAMCGEAAVVAALACAHARGATCRRLLHYTTSAAFSGDYHRVVGYAALSAELEAANP